jgi:RES domain-containing protein
VPATVSKAFGEAWCLERQSVALIVPSVVARVESDVLINPAHPEFRHITTTLHEPVFWDRRLFGS